MKHPFRVLSSALAAGALTCGGLVAFAAPAGASTSTLYVSTKGAPTNSGATCTTAKYTKIQTAVTTWASGEVIVVCAGTYDQGVAIPPGKTGLVLQGPGKGANPPATLTRTGTASGIGVAANTVTVTGLVIRGTGATGAPGFGFGIDVSTSVSGVTISTNLITNNMAGVLLNSDGARPDVVTGNVIATNNEPGSATGNGVYVGDGSSNLTITKNTFHGNATVGIVDADSAATSQHTVTVSNNTFTGTRLGIWLSNTAKVTISLNTISPTTTSAIWLDGGDSTVTVLGNAVPTTRADGVHVEGSANANVTAFENRFSTTDAGGGVIVTTGSLPIPLTAQGNWWGAPTGPGSTAKGAGAKVSATVDYSNWCTTDTPCPSAPSAPTAVTAAASVTAGSAQISWKAPVTDGGSTLTGYTVTPNNVTTGTAGSAQTVGPTATKATIAGLASGDQYTFTVQAKNDRGTGPGATSTPTVTIAAPPKTTTPPAKTTPPTTTPPKTTPPTTTPPKTTPPTTTPPTTTPPTTTPPTTTPPKTTTQGYYEVAGDGGIFSFGSAVFHGSMGGKPLNRPVVGMATTKSGGYYELASDGGVFTFTVPFYGSMGGKPLNAPVDGMAVAANTRGYWLVAQDGGVFTFGSIPFYGSMGGKPLNAPMVGIAAAPTDRGYWEVGSDGGVFTFGSIPFYGSLGGDGVSNIVGIVATTAGYDLIASTGTAYSFTATGESITHGGFPNVVGTSLTRTGGGRWDYSSTGAVNSLGVSKTHGSMAGKPLNAAVVGGATYIAA